MGWACGSPPVADQVGGGSATTTAAHPEPPDTSTVAPTSSPPTTSPGNQATSSTATVSPDPDSATTTVTADPVTTTSSTPTATTSPGNQATSSTATVSPDPDSATTTVTADPVTTTSSTPTATSSTGHPDPGDVSGFEVVTGRLGDRSLLLALADTTALRSRGLMGVESLGDLDGMVFAWQDPQNVSFWMKNTLIPLDIGYFDEKGALFLVLSMVPCPADPCPTYPSESPILYALEAIPGFFDGIPLGEHLILGEFVPPG